MIRCVWFMICLGGMMYMLGVADGGLVNGIILLNLEFMKAL